MSQIQRFSSRTHRLDQTILTKYLKQARRYHRIAGYFTSSLFEIAGEHLDGIEEVRIVCNSEVRAEDIKIAKIQESKLLGRLNRVPVEAEALLNRPRYKWSKIRPFVSWSRLMPLSRALTFSGLVP